MRAKKFNKILNFLSKKDLVIGVFILLMAMMIGTALAVTKLVESRTLRILVEGESNLMYARDRLVQNRLNWLSLARLNPEGVQFNLSRVDIIQSLTNAINEDEQWLNRRPARERVFNFWSKDLDFYNSVFIVKRSEIYNKHRQNIQAQKNMLNHVSKINNSTHKLLNYFPASDLLLFDTDNPQQRQQLLQRIRNTIQGIDNTKTELQVFLSEEELEKFYKDYESANRLLKNLEVSLYSQSAIGGNQLTNTGIAIDELKIATYALLIDYILSDLSTEILASQANIIGDYKLLLTEIKSQRNRYTETFND